jgi:hypothetical protein
MTFTHFQIVLDINNPSADAVGHFETATGVRIALTCPQTDDALAELDRILDALDPMRQKPETPHSMDAQAALLRRCGQR